MKTITNVSVILLIGIGLFRLLFSSEAVSKPNELNEVLSWTDIVFEHVYLNALTFDSHPTDSLLIAIYKQNEAYYIGLND